jgi:L-iditol 2-dehydrogenase
LRVAVYHSNNDIRIEDRPRPSIGPGELLLRIEASGICGSDVMEWYRAARAPIVLGHEVAGVVEEVGTGVEDFTIGDRIVATHHVPCGDCRYCRSDRESVCETLRTTHFDPGGFAEFVRLPAINVELGTFGLPDSVSFEEGTFVEPLACVVRAQRLTGLTSGEHVAVLGSGISGILQIQLARANGAERIYASDVSDHRLEVARRFGADTALPADGDLVERVLEANAGRRIDRVLVCTGALGALHQALELVDLGGTVLFFAPTEPEEKLELSINDLWKRNVSIVHSYAGPPGDMRTALDLIAERKVDVASMVTHRLPLAKTAEGFRLICDAADSLKIIIRPRALGGG